MDPLRNLFLNNAGRLRSGWRLITFTGLFVILMFVVTGALRVVYALAINLGPTLAPGEHSEDLILR